MAQAGRHGREFSTVLRRDDDQSSTTVSLRIQSQKNKNKKKNFILTPSVVVLTSNEADKIKNLKIDENKIVHSHNNINNEYTYNIYM